MLPKAGRGRAAARSPLASCQSVSYAQNRAVRSRSNAADAALHNTNYPGHRRVVSEQLQLRRAKLAAHAASKVRQDKGVHPKLSSSQAQADAGGHRTFLRGLRSLHSVQRTNAS